MPPPVPKRSASVAGSGGRRSVAANSRSKSTVSRRRGEDALEIPNTAAIADGQRFYFIGGFSKHSSISSLIDISQENENCGSEVIVVPGTYSPASFINSSSSAAAGDSNASRPPSSSSSTGTGKRNQGEIAVRSLEVRAFHPPNPVPQSKVVNFVTDDEEDDGRGGGRRGGGGGDDDYDGDGEQGGGHHHDGSISGNLEQILAPAQPPIVRDVIFTGDTTFVRYVRPQDAAGPLAALAPEQTLVAASEREREPRNVRAMSMRSTASKKSVSSTNEDSHQPMSSSSHQLHHLASGISNRESATPSSALVGGDGAAAGEQHGVRPSTWPTISFRGISFERGLITLKSAHAVFDKCHFAVPNGSYFVQVMPYCRATFIDCTFSAPSKACIYAFPYSHVTCKQCHFSGLDLLAIQDDRDSAEQLAADRLDQSSRGMVNNVGVMADDAAIGLDNCHFLHLTHGVVLHHKCGDSKIKKCVFESIDGSAAFFGSGSQPTFFKNYIAASCTGRGVFFDKGSRPKASENQVSARVVIASGSAPLLKGNHFSIRIEEQNDIPNPYMEPKY